MKRLEQLKRQRTKIADQIYDIEKRERDRELSKAIGKFYKYRNCYSCPETDNDYWFLYSAVYRRGESVAEFRFQTDKYGKTEFEVNDWRGLSGYVEISKEEWLKAYKLAQAKVGYDFTAATESKR